MKEIELSEKNNNAYVDYAPVEVGENVTVESSRGNKNGSIVIDGTVKRSDDGIGRFVMDDKDGRLFVNVKVDGLKYATKRGIMETVAAIIMQLLPKDAAEETSEE